MCDLDSVDEFTTPQRHWESYSLEELAGAIMKEEIDKAVVQGVLFLHLNGTN